MAASTVPIGIAAEAHAYLAHGGPANLDQLARFLSDTVLLTGHGFEPPAAAPSWGPLERTPTDGGRRPHGGRALLPRPPHERQHRLHRDPVPGRRGRGRQGPPAVRRIPAQPRTRAHRHPARRRRDRHHGPRGGRHPARRGVGRRRRRVLGRGRAHRARRPDPPGALPHRLPHRLGGQRRGRLPAGRREPDRRARIRRPPDHRSVLLQGDRRGRPPRLRRRRRTRRPCGRHRRPPRPAAPHPERREARRARPLRVPDQALPYRQRRRTRHPRQRGRPAAPTARGGLRLRYGGGPRARLRRRRRADLRPHRGGRPRPGVAHRGAAGPQPGPYPRRRLPPLVRHAARRTPRGRRGALGPAARRDVRGPLPQPGGRHRARRAAPGQPPHPHPAPARLRREPDRDLPRPGSAALAPLPGRLPLDRRPRRRQRLRRRRDDPPRQARQPRMAARQERGPVRLLRSGRGARRPSADLPVPRQRPGRGHPGQAPGARHAGGPPGAADGPGRQLRGHRPPGTTPGRARPDRGHGPGQAAGDPRPDLDPDPGREARPRPGRRGPPGGRGLRRLHHASGRLAL